MKTQSSVTRIYLCILIATASIAIIVAAEKPINFSGTWTLDPTQTQVNQTSPEIRKIDVSISNLPQISDSNPSQVPTVDAFPRVLNTGTLQILQTENGIQTIRRFPGKGQERTAIQKFNFDGSLCLNVASNGLGEFASRSSWKNNKLIHSGSYTIFQQEQRVESYVTEEYSLSKNGKKLTIKTTATGPNGVTTTRQTYLRQDK